MFVTHQVVGDIYAPSWYPRSVSATDERVVLAMKAALYARISFDRSGNEVGVSTQVADCRKLAAQLGWTIVQDFIENDTSAFKRRRVLIDGQVRYRVVRPVFAELLDAARAGRVDAIVVLDLDRMARDPRDLEDLIEVVEHSHVQVRSVTGSLNLTTDSDVAMARVLVAMANKSSRDTARRVSRAAQRNAEAGRWRGRRCVGYRPDGALVAEEAQAVREGVQAVIAGASLHEVGRRWDRAGLARMNGGSWLKSLTKLKQVLTAWRIAAIPVHRDNPLFDVEAQWEPIVTRAELEQVRDILLSPERRTNTHRAARRSLLSGLAACGRCGAPLRSSTHEGSRPNRSTSRVQIYRCSGIGCGLLIRAWRLDEPVVEATLAELLTADVAALAPDEHDRQRMTELRDELEHIDKARQDVLALVSERLLTVTQARSSLEALKAREEAAQRQLGAIAARFGPAQFVQKSRSLLLLTDADRDARADVNTERFHELDLNQRRCIISAMVTVIVRPGSNGDRVVITSKASGKRITFSRLQAPVFVSSDPLD